MISNNCTEDHYFTSNKSLEDKIRLTDISIHPELRYFQNNQLPIGKERLNVLCLGNSYTIDALTYVPTILYEAGIQQKNCAIYYSAISEASLQRWSEAAKKGELIQLTHCAGEQMPIETGTLEQLLEQDWDIITLQQYSYYATQYTTFNPWLHQLINLVRMHCTNPNITLAWQTAWSYSELFGSHQPSYNRWLYISLAVQQMIMNDGIDVLIPTGTAIQNARCTKLNTANELTRDGTHLDLGVGRYIAACTWVQSLFAPVFGFTIVGNKAIPQMWISSESRYESRPLTEENREQCQRCAVTAVENPFAISF